jgi:putative ABC transport system permease protein
MLKNYLITAFRNLKRHKVYSAINIVGLAIGFAVSLVITFYVIHDLTFDRFHDNAENIYRVLSIEKKTGVKNSITSGPLMKAIKENIPEIRAATRLAGPYPMAINRPGIDDVPTDDPSVDGDLRHIRPTSVITMTIFTDSGFFKVFDFKILAGAKADALNVPGSIFLTPRIAKARFGKENPLGKPLSIKGIENAYVAGIVEAPPSNSHIQFEAIAPLYLERMAWRWDSWENLGLNGYVSLHPNADPSLVNKKIRQVAEDNNFPKIFVPQLQPLLDVHLGSAHHLYDYSNRGKNEASVVYIMGMIGLIILLIACFNFINLSTSRAATRATEVGIRKVVGARRINLAFQFLGEALLMTITSFFIALIIVKITLPSLDTILRKELEVNFAENPLLILLLFIIAVFIGFISGIFPSLVLSSFKPVNILKGKFHTGKAGLVLRKILVVIQFVITTSLIVGVLFIIAQINFLQSRDMGYNWDNVVVVPRKPRGEDILKNNIAAIPGVVSLGRVETPTSYYFSRIEVFPKDDGRTNSFRAIQLEIDDGFLNALEIAMLKGRNFSKQFATDKADAVIVSETFVKRTGRDINNLMGKLLSFVDRKGNIFQKKVIGVTEDFHYLTARQALEPMVLHLRPDAPYLMIRLTPGQISRSFERIKGEGKKLYPHRPPRTYFFDKDFDVQFENDREFARNIGIFAIIGIFIACLGQIGLVSYTIEQRRKEIVVRKVFGCGELKVVSLLSLDFLRWVVLACVIAWPCGYLAIKNWVNEFVYRIPFTVWPFLLAAAGSLIIAFLTLSFQTFKAARANPADTLREVG